MIQRLLLPILKTELHQAAVSTDYIDSQTKDQTCWKAKTTTKFWVAIILQWVAKRIIVKDPQSNQPEIHIEKKKIIR